MPQHLAVADWWANLEPRDRLDVYSLAPSAFIPERFVPQLRSHGVNIAQASAISTIGGQQMSFRLHVQPEPLKTFLTAIRERVATWDGSDDDTDLTSWAPPKQPALW